MEADRETENNDGCLEALLSIFRKDWKWITTREESDHHGTQESVGWIEI